jgi:hypothetical protein
MSEPRREVAIVRLNACKTSTTQEFFDLKQPLLCIELLNYEKSSCQDACTMVLYKSSQKSKIHGGEKLLRYFSKKC